MKIMIYSQHVLGIGHFFRSMEIAKALNRHRILFVEGGDPFEAFVPPPHVGRQFLPALMMDSEFKTMEAREGNLEEIKAKRQKILMHSFLDFAPDVLVTELFPFGRKAFRFELLPILEHVQRTRSKTKVICSLRDILVEKKEQAGYEERVLETLNTYFHLLLIHSDPRLTTLDETFERVDGIRIPFHYTGFVVRQAPSVEKSHHGKIIVASSGGGKVGVELLAATIEAVRALPDENLKLRVFCGPFMAAADLDQVASLACRDPRTTVSPFSVDFLNELAQADLSISMAGYNTCMDILSAGVNAIVYPFPQNREQAMRGKKLERLGLLRVLETLEVQKLSSAVREALDRPTLSPRGLLDLSGAGSTALLIEKYSCEQPQ